MVRNKKLLIFALAALLAGSCATAMLPGTHVPDTPENRDLLRIIDAYVDASQRRDVQGVLELVSFAYYEDMGTLDEADDYGYEKLRDEMLPKTFESVGQIYLQMRVDKIVIEEDVAHAEVHYTYRARIDLPAGTKWKTGADFNKIDFALEQGMWRIVAGL